MKRGAAADGWALEVMGVPPFADNFPVLAVHEHSCMGGSTTLGVDQRPIDQRI